ncbi:hypothetical protein OTK49_00420 [Vibrio coralliirubri]|uniref:hypothetical protein n=1 Tax=Vibrio coralliirubri TaxID=1516159 RepID=UPI0022836AB7|nr:hypothetical protein [Vibrio coralliirubri]MCY9861005.1 hypothetical protein [Vibrio coralliirubri]
MRVEQLSTVTYECELAANAFSVNDIGLALMHTTKSLMHCIKCSGNIETFKELLLFSDNPIVGQSPNKMSAIAITLLYQASFHSGKGEAIAVIETLIEVCALFNVDVGVLSIEDFNDEESINDAAVNVVKSNSKIILEAINNA